MLTIYLAHFDSPPSLLVYAIKDEQWYEFCEKFLKDASAGGTPIDRHTFITTVKNPVTKQLEQLEFDAGQFKHDYHSGVGNKSQALHCWKKISTLILNNYS